MKRYLEDVAPLYNHVATGAFPNRIGDALEIVTEKALQELLAVKPQHSYHGHFLLHEARNRENRYVKVGPPDYISDNVSLKRADFHLHGFASGPALIECKNYREWIYPHHQAISDLIIKAVSLKATPVLIARRIHYSTFANLLTPAGIIAHETYFQYYPEDEAELASKVRDKRLLGFTDVSATLVPHPRTVKFFTTSLPAIIDSMRDRFAANSSYLLDYATGLMSLADLYKAIGSPAAANWTDDYNLQDIPF